MSLSKYKEILSLKKFHGVSVGEAYINDTQGAQFIECIGKELKSNLCKDIAKAKFYSVLCNGSTAAVMEEEAIYILYFDPEPTSKDCVEVKLGF